MRPVPLGRAERRDAASSGRARIARIRTLPASLPRTAQRTPATRPHRETGSHARAGVTRYASPKLAGYAGLVGAALLGALALRRPELVALAGAFALPLTLALGLDRAPSLRIEAALGAERALQGDEVTLTLDVEGDPVERLELVVELPYGIVLEEGATRGVLRLAREQEQELRAAAAVRALGRLRARRRPRPRPRPFRRPPVRAAGRAVAAAQGLPPRREPPGAAAAAGDAGVVGQPGRAHARRGDRVRRPAPVRGGRPAATDQLARERAPRDAVGQRGAPRAERRHRPLPGHVRRGAANRPGHARPRRRRRGLARGALPAAQGPGRPRSASAASSTG